MLIASLLAQSPTPSPEGTTGGGLGGLIIFLPFIALFFFMMRRQGKQRREHMELVQSIQIGDEIETVAGMYGHVRRLSDEALWVEMAPNVEVKIARASVRRKVLNLDELGGTNEPGS